jgi:hypothetical protein
MHSGYCLYYQAKVNKPDTGFLTATLRSFEHLCFDRSLNKEAFLFEFFVPAQFEQSFLELMYFYEQQNMISDLKKLPNRLQDPNAEL